MWGLFQTGICYEIFTATPNRVEQGRTGGMQGNPVMKAGLSCNYCRISPVTGKNSNNCLALQCSPMPGCKLIIAANFSQYHVQNLEGKTVSAHELDQTQNARNVSSWYWSSWRAKGFSRWWLRRRWLYKSHDVSYGIGCQRSPICRHRQLQTFHTAKNYSSLSQRRGVRSQALTDGFIPLQQPYNQVRSGLRTGTGEFH